MYNVLMGKAQNIKQKILMLTPTLLTRLTSAQFCAKPNCLIMHQKTAVRCTLRTYRMSMNMTTTCRLYLDHTSPWIRTRTPSHGPSNNPGMQLTKCRPRLVTRQLTKAMHDRACFTSSQCKLVCMIIGGSRGGAPSTASSPPLRVPVVLF